MKQPGEQDIADLFDSYFWDACETNELDHLEAISQGSWDKWQTLVRAFCEQKGFHYYIRKDGTVRREP